MRQLIPLIAVSMLLAACSQGESPATPKSKAAADTATPTMENRPYNPWQDQMKAMDKARSVEGMLQQGAEARDRQLRQMEQ